MQLQNAIDDAEWAELTRKWGATPTEHHQLHVAHPFLSGANQLLTSDRRRAEVCYIMHRGDPAAGLLLHIKTFYPPGAYRLPTGGIHWGEWVEETLAREIWEETGLPVGAGAAAVQVERFLGVLSYEMVHREEGRTHTFATYCFLTRMPADAMPHPLDAEESILDWRWCALDELPDVAGTLAGVGPEHPDWAHWGRYRALSHRFVHSVLSRGE